MGHLVHEIELDTIFYLEIFLYQSTSDFIAFTVLYGALSPSQKTADNLSEYVEVFEAR